MTKRMLSLLLALVMTLSLCVPALAAGEFAEPVTEVEEQAPVAPVALEPEAEVEPAADEAVAAAVTADVPVEAIATAPKEEIQALDSAIAAAHLIQADVEAGKYISNSYTFEKWYDGDPDQGVTDYLAGIKEAEALRTKVQTYYDPATDSGASGTIQKAIDKINTFNLSNVVSLRKHYDFFNQVQTITTDMWQVVAQNANLSAADFQDGYYAKYQKLYLSLVNDNKIASTSGYPIGDQMDYATAISVLEQTLDGDKLYTAFRGWQHITAVKYDTTMWDATTLLPKMDTTSKSDYQVTPIGKAVKAIDTDKTRLVTAYTAVQTILDGGVVAGDKKNVANSWVTAAKKLLDNQQANGLRVDVTKFDVDAFVARLNALTEELTVNKAGAKIVSYQVNHDHNKVTVAVERSTTVADTYHYALTASYDGGPTVTVALHEDGANTSNSGRYYAEISANTINAKDSVFLAGRVLTLKLYTWNDAKGELDKLIQTKEITFDFTYIGPDIISASYNKGATSGGEKFTAVLNSTPGLFAGSFTVKSITVTRPDATTKTVTDFITNKVDTSWSDNPIQVGTYKLALNVVADDSSDKVAMTRPAVEVTVPAITSYTNVKGNKIAAATPYGTKGYDSLLKAIAGAEGYEKLVATAASGMTTADAQKVVKNNLDAANAIVAAAAKTPDTFANDEKVNKALADLTSALNKLTTEADQSDLIAAIAEAEALVESDYTKATWAALNDAVKAGKTVKAKAITSSTADAAAIAQAAKDIRSAIAKLAAVQPDKTTLQALVDSVPARLAANNYTDASKAAVNAAVTAANAVLANRVALKSEVAEATEDLQTALAALEVAEAGVQPPVGGTGWVKFNGLWYYFVNNVMKKNYWVTNGSQHDLWYHMGADGTLDTGFQYIEDKTFGHGWYMLQGDDSNGMLGAMLTGWQDTKIAGMGWFVPDHNGNYGDCTWTKAWGNYYPIANTWDVGGSHITK